MADPSAPSTDTPKNLDELALQKRAQELRVRLFDILEFTRSTQLRNRVAALTFGDMIQEAIEAIDSDERPDDAERLPFEVQTPGKLQDLSELESIADETFKGVRALLKDPLYGDLEKDDDITVQEGGEFSAGFTSEEG